MARADVIDWTGVLETLARFAAACVGPGTGDDRLAAALDAALQIAGARAGLAVAPEPMDPVRGSTGSPRTEVGGSPRSEGLRRVVARNLTEEQAPLAGALLAKIQGCLAGPPERGDVEITAAQGTGDDVPPSIFLRIPGRTAAMGAIWAVVPVNRLAAAHKLAPAFRALAGMAGAAAAGPAGAPEDPFLRAVERVLDLELGSREVLDLVLSLFVKESGADLGAIFAVEGSEPVPLAARSRGGADLDAKGLPVSRKILGAAIEGREPVVVREALEDPRFIESRSVGEHRLRSVIVVPVARADRVIGAIYLDNRSEAGHFDAGHLRRLGQLAGRLASLIENYLARERERTEIGRLQTIVRQQAARDHLLYRYDDIVGESEPMLALLKLLDRVIPSDLPVLIEGESGTGKELVARVLHGRGPRGGHPFVAVNCAALPETLLESELFGHCRGAFTGADSNRTGLFEAASGGTIFLDEVGEMSPAMQGKLLRVLQEKEVRPVGATESRSVDIRVVAATNRTLREMVDEGTFREDLFYRLVVVHIRVPPLRERPEDIPLLVRHVLARLGKDPPPVVTAEAMAALRRYAWPGNVRQLENEIQRAALLVEGPIDLAALSPYIAHAGTPADPAGTGGWPEAWADLPLEEARKLFELTFIRSVLDKVGGNKAEAARRLGVSRRTLYDKLGWA